MGRALRVTPGDTAIIRVRSCINTLMEKIGAGAPCSIYVSEESGSGMTIDLLRSKA